MERGLALCLLAFVTSGCLDPLVSDDVPLPELVRPAGWEPPWLYDDPEIAAQVDAHDGVDREVVPVGGFAEGDPISYWDFGPAPDFAAPMYVLRRRMGDLDEPVLIEEGRHHPHVLDTIPGATNYSPYWAIYIVYVTAEWTEEHRITSIEELEAAREAGLVEAPFATGLYANCPVVHPDVRVMIPERSGGMVVGFTPKMPIEFYYRGTVGTFFDLSGTSGPDPLVDQEQGLGVHVTDVYVLKRPGEPVLSEPARHVDITGDGDLLDTNNILQYGAANAAHSPLRRVIEVTIDDSGTCRTGGLTPRARETIDVTGSGTSSDWNSAAVLFESTDGQLVANRDCVLAWEDTGELLNLGMLGGDY